MIRGRAFTLAVVAAGIAMAGLAPARDAAALEVRSLSIGASGRSIDSRAAGTATANAGEGAGRVSLVLGVRPNLEWAIGASGGSTTSDPGTGAVRLPVLRGVSTALLWRLAGDRLLLQGTLTTPSPNTAIRLDQVPVVEAIALPYLGFDLRHSGNGLETGGTAALQVIGRRALCMTIGGGGLRREAYTFVTGMPRFLPASEWAMTAGMDVGRREESSPWPVRVDVTYRAFGRDRVGGVPVFREGAQVEARTQLEVATGSAHWAGVCLGVMKHRNTLLDPAAGAIANTKSSAGDDVFARLSVDVPAGRVLRAGLVADETVSTGSDDPARNGGLTAIGPLLRFAPGATSSLTLTGQYAFGSTPAAAGTPGRRLGGLAVGVRYTWLAGD